MCRTNQKVRNRYFAKRKQAVDLSTACFHLLIGILVDYLSFFCIGEMDFSEAVERFESFFMYEPGSCLIHCWASPFWNLETSTFT